MPELLDDARIRREIKRETYTASAIAVLVALLEFFASESFHLLPEHKFVFFVLLLSAIMGLFFFMMQVIGRWARRALLKEMQEPMPLDAVGIVNGLWVDAIWEEDSPDALQVSVIDIRRSRAEGFAIS